MTDATAVKTPVLVDETSLSTPRAPSRVLLLALTSAGLLLVALSYRFASEGLPAQLYYLVFWFGMLTTLVPIALRVVAANASRRDRLMGLTLFAVASGFPKFLRNAGSPSYHDEYAHWREAVDVLGSGVLFMPNTLIPIVQQFPGTSAVTAVLHLLSGISVWHAGVLIVHIMHAAGIVAVFIVVESCLDSARAGAIGGIVYALNPSAIYFDTQYAYESIAINFFLWILALGVVATHVRSRRRRRGFVVAALLLCAAVIVTHHLTAVFLIAALIAMVAISLLWPGMRRWGRGGTPALPRRDERRVWLLLLLGFVLLSAVWVTWAAPATIEYLRPYFGGSVGELNSIAREDGDTGRTLLAASVQPVWERVLTAAAPLLLGLVAVVAVWNVLRHRERWYSTAVAIMAFGLIYFPSVPFILAPTGAEGARRSWGFTYVGVALIVAFVLMHVNGRWSPRTRGRLAAVGFVVLLIGNVGGGLNDPYRFPGPWQWGTDTRSASPEARAVAETLQAQGGRVRVVTDAYTSLQLAAYGGVDVAHPSLGFPAWELVQRNDDPSPELAAMLSSSHFDFLVVDVRMAQEDPFNGHNFGQHDPLLSRRTPTENLERLDETPWASRIMTTEHLRVYRLDLNLIGRGVHGRTRDVG